MQHFRAGAVGEADVVEVDVAADRGRARRASVRVLDLGLLDEHVHDLVERGDGGEEVL